MAKWKSPFLSEIKNKLGDSVVFSSWKGRQYMRSYVEPANPNTSDQQAFRESMSEAVNRWQGELVGTPAEEAYDQYATPQQISGFNLFVRYFQGSDIEITNTPTSGGDIEVDYETNLPLDKAEVVVFMAGGNTAESQTEIDAESGSVTLSAPSTSGEYLVAVAHSNPEDYGAEGVLPACDVHRDPDAGTAERQTFSI